MVNAGDPLLRRQDSIDSVGEIARVGRRAYLVTYYTYFLSRRAEIEHSLYEILAVGRIQPRRAYDYAVGGKSQQRGLTLTFGGAILRDGIYLVRLAVRLI